MDTLKLTALTLSSFALFGCGQKPITSDRVPKSTIDHIQATVKQRYPNLSESLRHDVTEVAVHAIENMIWIEGGSFMMGDILMPCTVNDKQHMDWVPNGNCNTFAPPKGDTLMLHKVTLDSYSLARYENSMFDFDAYLQTLGPPHDKHVVQLESNNPEILKIIQLSLN